MKDDRPSLRFEPEPVPLRWAELGSVRVGGSRIPLERVVWAFNHGETPESFVEAFPALQLADIHAVIAYYLRHRAEVDAYVEERERSAAAIRAEIEAQAGSSEEFWQRLRERAKRNALPPA